MNVVLAYFTGTGSTKKVAEVIYEKLIKNDLSCTIFDISKTSPENISGQDLLILLSPVHAFRFVVLMEKWIKELPVTFTKNNVAVISVSAGGEVSPNTACRIKAKKLLDRKGYNVIYEDMFMMPSNFGTPSSDDEIMEMKNLLSLKASLLVNDIFNSTKKILKPKFQDRFISCFGKAEQFGTRFFGKMLKSSESCNNCGLCQKNCPSNNITIGENKVTFGFKCVWCMKCIYSCPNNSIYPRFLKSSVLKDGFVDYSKWDVH